MNTGEIAPVPVARLRDCRQTSRWTILEKSGIVHPCVSGVAYTTRSSIRSRETGEPMDLQESQYQNGLKLARAADETIQQLTTCLKRHDEPARIRRVIEDAEGILKRIKRELRVG